MQKVECCATNKISRSIVLDELPFTFHNNYTHKYTYMCVLVKSDFNLRLERKMKILKLWIGVLGNYKFSFLVGIFEN